MQVIHFIIDWIYGFRSIIICYINKISSGRKRISHGSDPPTPKCFGHISRMCCWSSECLAIITHPKLVPKSRHSEPIL